MLITASDFVGDYRLFNANNLDRDIIIAIDNAQVELAKDLFPVGHSFIVNNLPTDPPNLGLRQLGLHNLFVAWAFLRIEQGILGAGVKRTSDVPGRSRFAAGAFFSIARHYRYFLADWVKYEGHLDATATTPNTLVVSGLLPNLISAGMVLSINGSLYSIMSSSGGTLVISPSLPSSLLGAIKFRQLSLVIDRKWNYI